MLVGLVLGCLAAGPQVVRSKSFLTFSALEQCGPVSVNVSGDITPGAFPLTLTVIPFNTSPISIPLPNSSWNTTTSTGTAITFLPLPANSTFIASLDDKTGDNAVGVSEIIKILPSSNSSCIPAENRPSDTRFQLIGTLSQCQTFNVSFDPSLTSTPSVRAFIPRGPAFHLNQTAKASGIATYMLTASRGQELVLMFDDGVGHRETTALITVAGDSGSSTDCLLSRPVVPPSPPMEIAGSTALSRNATIAIAVSAGALVAVIALLMVIYVRRERRHRLTMPFCMEGGNRNPQPPPMRRHNTQKSHPPRAAITTYVVNPPYTKEGFMSPEPTELRTFRKCRTSWYKDGTTSWLEMHDGPTDVHGSVHSLDIEHILNVAVSRYDYSTSTIDEPAPLLRRSNDTPSPFVMSPARFSPNLTPRYDPGPTNVPKPVSPMPHSNTVQFSRVPYNLPQPTSPPLSSSPRLSSKTSSGSLPSHFSTPLFTEYIPNAGKSGQKQNG